MNREERIRSLLERIRSARSRHMNLSPESTLRSFGTIFWCNVAWA